jgi:selenocysteine-specific elongation factor
VDEEWLELAMEDVKDFIRGTFLEDTPVISVSSKTGQGIPDFLDILEKLSVEIPDRTSSGLFRLPVDRVFTMKGFGTVITGSLISGRIQVGDTIMIYPSKVTSKVRGIQVHNQSINEAEAGMRTAINFQGLEKTSVNRGDVLANPDALMAGYMVDISMNFLSSNSKPAKNRMLVRFHTGTSEVLGNLILLDKEELNPGEKTVAQLRLDSPVTLVKDDRFVLRSYSPVRTIGGGYILNPIPQKHKRFKPEIVEGLKRLENSNPEEIISYHVDESGYLGLSFSDLKLMTNSPEKQLDNNIQGLLSKKSIIQIDREKKIYIHKNIFERLMRNIKNNLNGYHKTNPLKAGMPREELKTKFQPDMNSKLFSLIINQMIKSKDISAEEETVRLADHKVSLGTDQTDIKKKIIETYKKSGLTPPYFRELSKTIDIKSARANDVLMLLVEEGIIIKTKEDLYFHADAVKDLENKLVDFLTSNGEMTTPQFKDMTGVSRKYLIPLIEYFDSKKVTLRIGDIRKLRKG